MKARLPLPWLPVPLDINQTKSNANGYDQVTLQIHRTKQLLWACLVARIRGNLARGMQPTRVWLPVRLPQPGSARAKALPRPGSQRTPDLAVPPHPGSLRAPATARAWRFRARGDGGKL